MLVHPTAGSLHGLRAYRTLADVPGQVDLVMAMVAGDAVQQAVQDSIDAGVPAVISIASGFEGVGGQQRRRDLTELLVANPGTRLVGPNSVGVLSTVTRSWTTFSSVLLKRPPLTGNIGLVTQSGAVGNGLLLTLASRGVGVAHWFSTGDEINVGALEVATSLLRRDDTKVVGLFMEGVTDARHRAALAQVIATSGKRVVAIRSAASSGGKAAAMGHTGRIVGDSEIGISALTEIGVDVVDNLDEFVEALTFLSVAPARREGSGPARVNVVTVSGAMGVVAADTIARFPSLALAAFDDRVTKNLAELVPSYSGDQLTNPLDVPVLGDPIVFERAVSSVVDSGCGEATLIVTTTLAHDYESISKHLHSAEPVVITHLSAAESFTPGQARRLSENGIAVLRSPATAVKALAIWSGTQSELSSAEHTCEDAGHRQATVRQFGLLASRGVLRGALDRWLVESRAVESADDAVAFFEAGPGDIALKAEGSAIAHRTELGAVEVRLSAPAAVRAAYDRVSAVCREHGDPVVAQRMSRPGVEVLVSVLRDPELGVVAVCRLGGTLVELGETPTLVLTDYETVWPEKLRRSPLGRVLAGWRGAEPADSDALLTFVHQLRQATADIPDLAVVECNPVLVHPKSTGRGLSVVDVVIYLDENEGAA